MWEGDGMSVFANVRCRVLNAKVTYWLWTLWCEKLRRNLIIIHAACTGAVCVCVYNVSQVKWFFNNLIYWNEFGCSVDTALHSLNSMWTKHQDQYLNFISMPLHLYLKITSAGSSLNVSVIICFCTALDVYLTIPFEWKLKDSARNSPKSLTLSSQEKLQHQLFQQKPENEVCLRLSDNAPK